MPDWGTIDVFQIDPLPIRLLVIICAPLICELRHVAEIVTDGECHILVLAQIAGLLDYVSALEDVHMSVQMEQLTFLPTIIL